MFQIGTTSVPNGTVGLAYTATIYTVWAAYPPYSWTLIGSLPPGLTLDSSDGPSVTIAGTPTAVGSMRFGVSVTNSVQWCAEQTLLLTVTAPTPTISSLSPSSATAGGPAFTLTVSGSGFLSGATVEWKGAPMVTSYVSSTQLTASAPQNLTANSGTASVIVVNPGATVSNALTVTVTPAPPAVTNDASFATQVSPGSLAALFGNGNVLATTTVSGFSLPLPTSVNGTSVTMDGIPCPLVYVSSSQINLQVPAEVQPGTASVVVNHDGQMFSTTVQVLTSAPGIFTTDYYVNGGVAILQDSATGAILNASNPAAPGENVTIYLTGIGPVTNNPGTGEAAPPSPLSQAESVVGVTVSGISSQPSFTGLTPGFAGLAQVNFQLPAKMPSRGSVPVVLTINGVSAKTVQISVH